MEIWGARLGKEKVGKLLALRTETEIPTLLKIRQETRIFLNGRISS